MPRTHKQRVKKRIAVVGLTGSGKTTFPTSLISHIVHHDPSEFPILDGRKRQLRLTVHPDDDSDDDVSEVKGAAFFAYGRFRDRLRVGEWPDKTIATYQCQLRVPVCRARPLEARIRSAHRRAMRGLSAALR